MAPDGPFFAHAQGLIGASIEAGARPEMPRKVMGVIHDLVVECASGSVTHVIVSSGERATGDTLRRLPFSDLSFTRAASGKPEVRLAIPEAQFEATVPLTQVMLDAYRTEAIVGRHPATREAYLATGPKEDAPLAGGLYMLMLASELDDLAVRSTAELGEGSSQPSAGVSMGLVDELWIDLSSARVMYWSLVYEDRRVVLPLDMCGPSLDLHGRTVYLATPCGPLQLSEAPALDVRFERTLDHARFRRSVGEFYARSRALHAEALAVGRAVIRD